jgi:phosphoribosylformylglycinamidine cyclo-ligase
VSRENAEGKVSEAITYADAGVDRQRAAEAKAGLAQLGAATAVPGVVGAIGGFAGLFAVPPGMKQPLLVSGCDGVGTKLRVAIEVGRHNTVGIDLVAMCVNDVLCSGAKPLFFLDYFATGHLEPEVVRQLLAGIAEGCRRAGCALLGGEMAELPGLLRQGDYDLAGFAVGAVEADALIDGRAVRPGMALLGLASSGLHANGFALARKVLLEVGGLDLRGPSVGGQHSDLADELLEPTLLYSAAVQTLLAQGFELAALAHITGGGLAENLARVMPPGCQAQLRRGSWPEPALLAAMARLGVADAELIRVFNLGIGFVAVLAGDQVPAAQTSLAQVGYQSYLIGDVATGPQGCTWR